MRLVLLGAVLCIRSIGLAGATVELTSAASRIEVVIDGKPFTTYYVGPETAKPYLMPLRTASGQIVTRGFPVGNDVSGQPRGRAFEPHQRPLYFGHGDIDGLDFWQEPVFDQYYRDHGHQAYGHMVLKSPAEVSTKETPGVLARFTLQDPSNRVIGEETQSFQFQGDAHTRIIDCVFTLYATAGPLDIGDTKEGTFGIRLAPELSAPLDHMVNSNGAEGEKAIWGKPADWVDYSGTVGGGPVGVAVFDHPKSFRHPTTWHARAYGLLAANPFGLREFTRDENKDGAWTIPEGKSVTFRYRVLIHDGDFPPARIGEAYRRYAARE